MGITILEGPTTTGVPRWCPNCTKTFYQPHDNPLSHNLCTKKPIWLVLRDGKYGKFWGCPNFPKCKYSESVPKPKEVYIDDAHWDRPEDQEDL